ncbi:sugar kinase, partial [Actinotalea fermentans ATCC 43279 = JCM 9966 = DSM 3133]
MSLPTHRTAVGIDLGGTKIAAGLVRDDGTVLARAGVPTPARAGADAILDAVARLVTLLLPDGADAPGA